DPGRSARRHAPGSGARARALPDAAPVAGPRKDPRRATAERFLASASSQSNGQAGSKRIRRLDRGAGVSAETQDLLDDFRLFISPCAWSDSELSQALSKALEEKDEPEVAAADLSLCWSCKSILESDGDHVWCPQRDCHYNLSK